MTRPEINPGDFVSRGAECLGVEIADLRTSSRGEDLVRARELLTVLGVERYRLKVKELAPFPWYRSRSFAVWHRFIRW